MADTKLSTALGLDRSATGYAAVIDGVLDVRTVADTKRGAVLNALGVCGIRMISNCNDPDCDCWIKALPRMRPGIDIVRCHVEAREAE